MRDVIGWGVVIWRFALREYSIQLTAPARILLICVTTRPSLMGQHTGSQIADASLQARVLDTILVNATAIFDED